MRKGVCAKFVPVCLVLGSCLASVAIARSAQAQPAPISVAEGLETAFTQVAESVSSSVVAIRIESRRKLTNPFGGFPFGDFFGVP